MASRASPVKLGLFVILALGAVALGIVTIGARKLHLVTVSYVTYFDESVSGLDVGALVKARGVPIGQVGGITFAPDHRMIQVKSDLSVKELERLGLRKQGQPPNVADPVPSDLRAQLASQGLTGGKFVSLDFFDTATNPPPKLSFPTPERYIPAAPSFQKGLETTVARTLDGVRQLVDTLNRDEFGDKLAQTVGNASAALDDFDKILKGFESENFSSKTTATIVDLHAAVDKARSVLTRIGGDNGLVASAQRTLTTFGDVGRNAEGATHNLDEVLEEIRAAAGSIRLLANELERDPDMLLKGHAYRKPSP